MGKIVELNGYTDYLETETLFTNAKEAIVNKKSTGLFYILEHNSVFTVGKHGGTENLLQDTKIPLYKTERGGNITYHGPGQVVIYPIINLKELKIGVKNFIYRLEDVVIKSLEHFDINSERNTLNHGVWVKKSKIASVGVKITQGVTQHGIALNINTDLTPFSFINPCGLQDIKATSAAEVLGEMIDMNKVKTILKKNIKEQFPECFYE